MRDLDADVLEQILVRVDLDRPLFTADEVLSFDRRNWAATLGAGLVRPTASAATAECEWCAPSHAEDVEYIPATPGAPVRPCINCPELGVVEIPAESLLQWDVDVARLAELVAAALRCVGRVEEQIPGRLWALGRLTDSGAPRDVFLARRLVWPPGAAAAIEGCPAFRAAAAPVVLVAGGVPAPEAWRGTTPAVVRLGGLLRLGDDRLAVDPAALAATLGTSPAPRGATAPPASPGGVRVPPGARWSDVSIRFRDGHTVAVEVGGTHRLVTYAEMGLSNRTSARPDKQWLLLEAMAREHGALTWNNAFRDHRNKKRRARLSERLVAFFGIDDGDPITYDKDLGGWRTRFTLRPEGEVETMPR